MFKHSIAKRASGSSQTELSPLGGQGRVQMLVRASTRKHARPAAQSSSTSQSSVYPARGSSSPGSFPGSGSSPGPSSFASTHTCSMHSKPSSHSPLISHSDGLTRVSSDEQPTENAKSAAQPKDDSHLFVLRTVPPLFSDAPVLLSPRRVNIRHIHVIDLLRIRVSLNAADTISPPVPSQEQPSEFNALSYEASNNNIHGRTARTTRSYRHSCAYTRRHFGVNTHLQSHPKPSATPRREGHALTPRPNKACIFPSAKMLRHARDEAND